MIKYFNIFLPKHQHPSDDHTASTARRRTIPSTDVGGSVDPDPEVDYSLLSFIPHYPEYRANFKKMSKVIVKIIVQDMGNYFSNV